uniref:CCHC-type domain-containing protein n=1 Tax=Astyanax mexicanus TaxID=7994 RepID=A0A3B1IHV8_ASTMX
MVRDELGVWNGRRQYIMNFKKNSDGSWRYPPANFSLGGNRGYLFFRGQPAFCRGCQKYGHQVEGCNDVECRNCLGHGHLAKDCNNPRRCRGCGGEGHLIHSCPVQVQSYGYILNGFLEQGARTGACSFCSTHRPGIAVPPGAVHLPYSGAKKEETTGSLAKCSRGLELIGGWSVPVICLVFFFLTFFFF